MTRILLVEDDAEIRAAIHTDLCACADYYIQEAASAHDALRFQEQFDIILLDVMLPDFGGIALCGLLRKRYSCPILFVSCLDDSTTIVEALAGGGDDYVVKPVVPQILHARIQANLRRVKMERMRDTPHSPLQCDAFTLDAAHGVVHKNGQEIPLLPIECRLLTFLMENIGSYYKSKDLYREIWGQEPGEDVRTVLVHIHNLRDKIEDDRDTPRRILNVRGKGYTFDPKG